MRSSRQTAEKVIHLVDFFAREEHHILHARAIYDKMPPEHKGEFYTTTRSITASLNKYVVVFSFGDLKYVNTLRKKVIYSDHGTGMFYNVVHGSYAGSTAYRDKVVMRLSPNETHAKKERETLIGVPVKVVGVPKMDEWAPRRNDFLESKRYNSDQRPTVAISFHWDCLVCPETRSSYKHFAPALEELAENFNVIGHAHPRIMNEMRAIYKRLNIKVVADFPRVMREADIYICDNSSTIYEFAYLNKPVVLLNSPHYRKDVEHEGNPRFWKYADIGPQVDSPELLVPSVWEAWDYFDEYLPRMQEASKHVFTYLDGKCGERAVKAILSVLE